jgi:hypothetical protein
LELIGAGVQVLSRADGNIIRTLGTEGRCEREWHSNTLATHDKNSHCVCVPAPVYTCVDAYEEMTHKHTQKPCTHACTCAHACIHVPTCTRTRSHTRTVRRGSLNFRDQSRLGQVFAPRIVLDDFSLKRLLAFTRGSKSGFGVCVYTVHSDSGAIVVDHENHRVQFWDKDGTWLRSIGICVVSRECAQAVYAYKIYGIHTCVRAHACMYFVRAM